MDRRPLPHSDLRVSVCGLGTMMFGEQEDEAAAFALLDAAREEGVNLFDTAEFYPVPPREETAGDSERILGRWMRARGCRDDVVVASKASGPPRETAGPGAAAAFSRERLAAAVDGSLQRLGTDRIDLYQLHWPERTTLGFGRRGYPWETAEGQRGREALEEALGALGSLVAAGKIRHVGVCNESAWGVMRYLEAGREGLGPRIVSVQNPGNLLNRAFTADLSEVCHREEIRLLAYSPLAFGKLSGKYVGGRSPEGSRLAASGRWTRYDRPQAEPLVQAALKVARRAGLDPCVMALAWVIGQPAVASALVGASHPGQLRANLAAASVRLEAPVLRALSRLQDRFPDPCP